ncbi:MAG: hypothetical protein K9J12_00430 [Melioribacteraceae bacterium]|nr:hypothetical protein [Melioribacteraceae bacterium]MCF8265436.1 hypothetical protein [Melioribacteraceae bacterium]MCF8413660.1 hypothetical protein [Melioribacteraceae bacterium]MCF8431898.1 hypothetical protein [Melioribacteraceae bacterium]
MKTQDIVIAHPKTTEQVNALKAFMQALKIKFEISSKESTYNPEFVAKIKKSEQEFEEGNFKRVEKKDLHKFLGV